MNRFCRTQELLKRGAYCAALIMLGCNFTAQAQIAVLKDKETPLYEMPSTTSRKLAILAAGDTVRVLQNRGLWIQLTSRDQRKGWIYLGKNPELNRKPKRPATLWTPEPLPPGGISFHLGAFSSAFTYVGKISYRNLPRMDIETTLQYATSKVASFYLLYGNVRYLRPLKPRYDGWLTAGAGVINTVPLSAANNDARSNMVINYGLGVQRHLRGNNWLRADLRQFNAFANQGLVNFVEFTVGITIGVDWSKI